MLDHPGRSSIKLQLGALSLALVAALAGGGWSQTSDSGELDPADARILQVVEQILRLFQRSPDAVWPGFDLAQQPFLVYRPDAWALLVGTDADIEGFTVPPRAWPDFEHPVLYHAGRLGDLVGQLAFDYQVGELTMVAIAPPIRTPDVPGYADLSLDTIIFGFIVHEAFHQYQAESFGEIPWAPEERYPILDQENSVLAALEMHALMDALGSARSNERPSCHAALRRFLAVREERWSSGDAFVRDFEQALELREGTAKYVELRALDQAGMEDAIQLAQHELESRLDNGAVSPDDVARNRIYPVGAALGLLLDFLGVDWHEEAARAGRRFTFVALLERELRLDPEERRSLLERAREEYDHEKIVAGTERLVERYQEQYESALEAFEGQAGTRIELVLPARGLRRSRSSRARRFSSDEGRRTLCREYTVYALDGHDLTLRIERTGLLEIEDPSRGTKTVVFYAPGSIEAEAAEKQHLDLTGDRQLQVDRLQLRTAHARLRCDRPISLRCRDRHLRLEVRPE